MDPINKTVVERNITKSGTLTALLKDLKITPPMSYVYVAQGVLIIFINITFVLFILLRKTVRTSSKNCILASLFISHAIIGILCCLLPYRKGSFTDGILDIGSSIMIASFCNLMLVTLDRFLAIRYPMWYGRITHATVMSALMVVWLVPLLFMLTTLVYQRLTELAFVLVTLISMLALLVENALIYAIVRKQVKKIKRALVTSNGAANNNSEQREDKTNQVNDHKAFFVCMAMVLSYILSWMPATIYVLCEFLLDKKLTQKEVYLQLIVFLVFCNSISDPIIYTWFNRKLKSRIKQFVSERRGRAQTQLSLVDNSRN